MEILQELADRFMLSLDSELCSNSEYLKAVALLHEFKLNALSDEQATEIDDITGHLTAVSFNTGVAAGLRLGARIATGLLCDDK